MENYVIIHPIDEGQFGKVFKGRRKNTGQILALKFISKRGKSERDLSNLRQEIEILKQLKHENIILLLDAFETAHELCIVTELAQGELFQILEDDKSLPESEVRKIAQQLVYSLHYLHSNRVIHRDMKPQNILISAGGVVKLCDFGFARALSNSTQFITSIKGTPLYMAPELVQEKPYNHTVDLWSLGVILYELFVGQPPFFTNSIYSLIQLIIKEQVKYPDNMSTDFKDFLQGLLNKNPPDRLGWPKLLEHPFIKETDQEKQLRIHRQQKQNIWAGLEMNKELQSQQQIQTSQNKNQINKMDPRKDLELSPNSQQPHTPSQQKNQIITFDDDKQSTNRDISPRKIRCNDDIWNQYEQKVQDEKGATELRQDSNFLDRFLVLLSTNIHDIMISKDTKYTLQCGLKVICLVTIRGKIDNYTPLDITKHQNIPPQLFNLLRNILRYDVKQIQTDLLSDLIKTIGLFGKSTFDKNVGIDQIYLKQFFPLLPAILKYGTTSNDIPHQTLLINLIKMIGIFANQASNSPLLNINFFKEIAERKFILESISLFKIIDNAPTLHKFIVQVLSVIIHPIFGDILPFPWKRNPSSSVVEFAEKVPKFEQIKQCILNGLNQFGNYEWINILIKIYNLEEQEKNPNVLITRNSVLRIFLQISRISKEALEVFSNHQPLLQLLLSAQYNEDSFIAGCALQILISILKSLSSKKDINIQEHLNLNIQNIIDMFEKNIQTNPIISIICLNVMSEVLQTDTNLSQIIIQKFEQLQSYVQLNELLNPMQKNINKTEEIRKIEGSGFGCPIYGFNDGIINFLQKLFFRYHKCNNKKLETLYSLFEKSGLDQQIINFLLNLNQKSDVSPKGFVSFLILCHDTIFSDFTNFAAKIFQEKVLKVLCSLLRENQLLALKEWPVNYGGGMMCVHLLTAQLLRIFNLPFQKTSLEQILPQVTRQLNNCDIIQCTVNAIKYLQRDHVSIAITLLSRLILNSEGDKQFAAQFMNNQGLNLIQRFNLLNDNNQASLIIDTFNILSQLARISKNYYEPIHLINIYPQLKKLIQHSEATVRAKVCNFIGNICRHNAYFYDQLVKNNLISDCINCCKDSDKNTRKFACFAVGNAGFHNRKLYEHLRPVVPALVELLKDPEEKTRANAAGALGNFVRNSNTLTNDLIMYGALHQMLEVVLNDKGPSHSPRRIALFSIGNFCVYPECKQVYEELGIRQVIAQFTNSNVTQDAQIVKYANRIIQKLDSNNAPQ